jgi:hypothetical protein
VIDERPLAELRREFTRRSATVTISVPEAASAAAMVAKSWYLPVPRMRRERKLRPATTSGATSRGPEEAVE